MSKKSYTPKFVEDFNQAHKQKYQTPQQEVLARVAREVPNKAIIGRPINLSVMADVDRELLEKETQIIPKQEIFNFFNSKLKANQKIHFAELPLIVKSANLRNDSVIVEFYCGLGSLSQLLFSLKSLEQNKMKPSSPIQLNGESVKVFGKIQGSLAQTFKVLF